MLTEYRVVTNGHEFKIEVQKFTFWKGRPYWTELLDDTSMGGEDIPTFYKRVGDAEAKIERMRAFESRYLGEWTPVA